MKRLADCAAIAENGKRLACAERDIEAGRALKRMRN